jgi:hypothetical protein
MNTENDMSGRVNVVLPDEVYELVKDLAETERRSQSQMTAILVEEALAARGVLPGSKEPQPKNPIKSKSGGTKGGKVK